MDSSNCHQELNNQEKCLPDSPDTLIIIPINLGLKAPFGGQPTNPRSLCSGQDTLLEHLPPSDFAPAPAPLIATAQPTPEANGREAGCCTRTRFARPDHRVPCGGLPRKMPRKNYQVAKLQSICLTTFLFEVRRLPVKVVLLEFLVALSMDFESDL